MLTENSFPGSRAFARYMLRGSRLTIQIDPSRTCVFRKTAIEVLLFREACWQVELISVFPNSIVVQHRHLQVDSCELALGGGVVADVEGKVLKQFHRGSLAANLVRVPRGAWHGGSAGPNGVVWLSFQHWFDREPGWISEDWHER